MKESAENLLAMPDVYYEWEIFFSIKSFVTSDNYQTLDPNGVIFDTGGSPGYRLQQKILDFSGSCNPLCVL